MLGREYTDTVCILFSACVESFEFFLIDESEGMKEPYDGVVGLARNHPSHLTPEDGNVSGPLLVESLWKTGVISANSFSLHIAPPG